MLIFSHLSNTSLEFLRHNPLGVVNMVQEGIDFIVHVYFYDLFFSVPCLVNKAIMHGSTTESQGYYYCCPEIMDGTPIIR